MAQRFEKLLRTSVLIDGDVHVADNLTHLLVLVLKLGCWGDKGREGRRRGEKGCEKGREGGSIAARA